MNVAERNQQGEYYVNAKIAAVSQLTDADFPQYPATHQVHRMMTDLIEVQSKGFRGVVITAIVGKNLNPNFDPLENFYACNPRALFEGGIWDALTANNIPCGKSDPLNVAKNIQHLNEAWAQGRRPQSAALAAVQFLRLLQGARAKEHEQLVNYFFYRLVRYSRSITDFDIAISDHADVSRQMLANKLIAFAVQFPESGTIPQLLIAKMLLAMFASSSTTVEGGDESVFGTNTTSKKPADIWLNNDGKPTNLFEVTVKKVNNKRLDDCLDSLRALGLLENPVTFVCRFPNDIEELDVSGGSFRYKGKQFEFVDLGAFIASLSSLLLPEELVRIVDEMHDFISHVNISMRTKAGWNEIFSDAE